MVVIFAVADKMNFHIFSFCLVLALVFSVETTSALEYIHFRHHGKERSEEGRIVLEAPDGFAFESRDGQYFVITWENLITRKSDDTPFIPYTKTEMLERLKNEFPPDNGFYYLDMYDPFIIVYTTSRAFANWYGRLLEKLHKEYVLYWNDRGVGLTKTEFSMVVVVQSSEERFRQYTGQDGVKMLKEQCAYYNKLTNRIAMYDMSGKQAFREGNQRRATSGDIREFLTQPGSYSNIMAVIHEAVHQVGFNTGMHPRFAPNPVWICEGLAMLHEVPDTKSSVGWTRGNPHVNRYRMEQLNRYLKKPQLEAPIQNIIKEDKLFNRSDTALESYALAWGLTYYLVKKRPKELAAYLEILQEKKSDSDDSDEIRIREFESCFGNDWQQLYKEFFDFLRRL